MVDELIIKNMVCGRCSEAVREVFGQLGIAINDMQLGSVRVSSSLTAEQEKQLRSRLQEKGFELLDDKRTRLINQIKSLVISQVHHEEEASPVNLSTLLSEALHYDYSYLSRLFSSVEGRTIENYVISQKIERVKELLTYDELTLAEIAFRMHYSSTAHLSAQFKKVTGMSPTEFRKLQNQERKGLDHL